MKSTHSQAAAMIRKELKATFKGVKFSVTSSSYSNGNSIHIEWIDGPTSLEVKKISDKYEMGSFDGSDDCYHYDNRNDNIPQVKYVQERREMSQEASDKIGLGFGSYLDKKEPWDVERLIRDEFNKTSFA